MNKILTDEQHKLINELCDYVEANVAPENFDMYRYRGGSAPTPAGWIIKELTKEAPDPHVCGTSGCMVGYAPMAHPELHKDAGNWDAVSFMYCTNPSLWDFMFGDEWTEYQNTPQGSVERIRLALEFDGRMRGTWWDLVEGDFTEELRNDIERVIARMDALAVSDSTEELRPDIEFVLAQMTEFTTGTEQEK